MRRMIRDIALYTIARGLPALAGVVSVAWFVRAVQVDGYAAVALGLASANMVAMFGAGWVSQAILRFFPGNSTAQATALGAVLRGTLAATVFAAATCFVIFQSVAFATRSTEIAFASAALSSLLVVQSVAQSLCQAQGRAGLVATSEIIRATVLLGGAWTMLRSPDSGPADAVWINAAAYLVAVLLLLPWRGLHHGPHPAAIKMRPSRRSRRVWLARMWRYGAPLSAWLGLLMSMPLLERAILTHQLGNASMGTFAAAYDVFYRSASLLFAPLLMALQPRLMSAANTKSNDVLEHTLRLTLLAGISLSLLLVLFARGVADPAARLLGFPSGSLDPSLAMFLAAGGCAWQLGMLAHKRLEIQRRTGALLACLVAGLLVHTALVYALAAWAGIRGAALAAVASGSAYCVLTTWLGRRQSLVRAHG